MLKPHTLTAALAAIILILAIPLSPSAQAEGDKGKQSSQVGAHGSTVTADLNDKYSSSGNGGGNGGSGGQSQDPTPKDGVRDRWCETGVNDACVDSGRVARSDDSGFSSRVVASLHLPDPTPRLGPDPSVNEWNMLVVGFPIWLWTDKPTTLTNSLVDHGQRYELSAQLMSTTFTMGDGTTKTCAFSSVYPQHIPVPGSPSPTCGYVYQHPSKPGHPYTVTATNHWLITWTARGATTRITHHHAGSRTLTVGELQSLTNG